MLGSLYEKAWELDRSTLAYPPFYTASHRQNRPANTNHKLKHSKQARKMHLKNGDHSMHYGGYSDWSTESHANNKDITKAQQFNGESQSCDNKNQHAAQPNEASVIIPSDRSLEEIVDTILTAWAVLIQRYQRDTFHQFTWGIKDRGSDAIQSVQTAELDISNQPNIKSLHSKVSEVRSRGASVDPGSTLFLNDGTEAEVRSIRAVSVDLLTSIVDFRNLSQTTRWFASYNFTVATTYHGRAPSCVTTSLLFFSSGYTFAQFRT